MRTFAPLHDAVRSKTAFMCMVGRGEAFPAFRLLFPANL